MPEKAEARGSIRFDGGFRPEKGIASCGIRIQVVQTQANTFIATDIFHGGFVLDVVDSYEVELEGAMHAILYTRQLIIRLLACMVCS